jgi:hypothetical protein
LPGVPGQAWHLLEGIPKSKITSCGDTKEVVVIALLKDSEEPLEVCQ